MKIDLGGMKIEFDGMPKLFGIPKNLKLEAEPIFPGMSVWVHYRPEGIALTVEAESPIGRSPKIRTTLLLRWVESFVIVSLTILASIIVRFRENLAASWLISVWAVHHRTIAAVIIGFLVLTVGLILALWKRKQLFVYGIWEVVFGAFSAFQIGLLLFPAGDGSKLIGLASALYVVSRGTGNVVDAVTKEVEIERLKWEIIAAPPREIEEWPPSILPKKDAGPNKLSG